MLETCSNLFFGMECLGCGRASASLDPWLCPQCKKALQSLSKRYYLPSDDVVCLYPMEEMTKKLIHLLKYRGIPGIASYFIKNSELLKKSKVEILTQFSRPFYFVPVPLHPARFRERGYNQAEQIARALAIACKGEVCKWLYRKSFHISQTKLSKEKREKNVAGVFGARFPTKIPRRGSLIIVDDVYTTGATTGACIDALENKTNLELKICTLLYEKSASAMMDYVADKRAFAYG